MNTWEITENFIFTVHLKSVHREIAKQLSKKKLTKLKAKEFYYNVLATCAIKDYLEILGYETDWNNSDFNNPVISTFADVVDLEVKNHGKLECRAVFFDGDIDVPEDVWSNRIGYVFAHIDESFQEAKILGFVSSVEETQGIVSLNQLRSLEDFPEYLSQKEQSEIVRQTLSESIKEGVVIIRHWFKETKENIGREWQNAEELLMRQPQNLSYMTRNSSEAINKAKLIDLKMNLASQAVMLLMTVTPQSEQKLKIRARLCPVSGEKYLPSGLKLEILSQLEESLKEVKSELRDYFIQLPEFTSESGDKFKLRITLGDANITEEFIV
ncbi:hypothetical protein VF14_17315 [Nostoc linckia z18]|uniref:DUF1822 family protein n=2 Tax=Nostoc linckia TaxID=92942 RepID=A0A9Q5ZBN2_NOSLI|nr:DUF1822 family protein [Nostoc linckia]PHK40753.1 hypothetical protein VF12_09280 [Nostoc linckia z15]PHK46142.1 hypothetical protein VF13_12415 [Nostoc linckia z16]PHJ59715.1 hypothetical protein VF02_24165 [Nostoc linckia z1]PHJ63182.1 hypothetical protein VF05_25340 [Nostoc linckia z3]PHJ70030.1 hypothetical protein VF03_22715 [Nostoc linckia z2]